VFYNSRKRPKELFFFQDIRYHNSQLKIPNTSFNSGGAKVSETRGKTRGSTKVTSNPQLKLEKHPSMSDRLTL
jgi:hypothetical protein